MTQAGIGTNASQEEEGKDLDVVQKDRIAKGNLEMRKMSAKM
jgi:hypothetical protein